MTTLYFILLLLSALSFVAAALGRGVAGDNSGGAARRGGLASLALVPLGLLFWVLVPLIETARRVF